MKWSALPEVCACKTALHPFRLCNDTGVMPLPLSALERHAPAMWTWNWCWWELEAHARIARKSQEQISIWISAICRLCRYSGWQVRSPPRQFYGNMSSYPNLHIRCAVNMLGNEWDHLVHNDIKTDAFQTLSRAWHQLLCSIRDDLFDWLVNSSAVQPKGPFCHAGAWPCGQS